MFADAITSALIERIAASFLSRRASAISGWSKL